jgi:hypothetical protein
VITIDTTTNTLSIVSDTFSGLLGTTTSSHIQCCTASPGVGNAGVATETPSFPGFPLGVTSGSYSMNFDMTLGSTWNPRFRRRQRGHPRKRRSRSGSGCCGRRRVSEY